MIVQMQVNGQSIEWRHLTDLYDRIQSTSIASQGLSILPKLKLEHDIIFSYEGGFGCAGKYLTLRFVSLSINSQFRSLVSRWLTQ